MCIPSQRASALPPTSNPSMQAASGLALGGFADRGGAGLGRLLLRQPATTQTAPKSTPVAASAVVGLQPPPAPDANLNAAPGAGNYQTVPNKGLRLPGLPS